MAERLHIQLLGTSFSIQTDEKPEYLQSLLSYLEKKIAETERALPTRDPLRIAILTGLFLVDELFRERDGTRDEFSDEEAETARIASRIIEQLDHTLQDS